MKKKINPTHTSLHEMSSQQLGQLFPIILSEHRDEWKDRYREEAQRLSRTLGDDTIIRMHHIGSTAVEGLIAKPTIDILLEVDPDTDLPGLIRDICSAGYLYPPQPGNPAPHMMYMKGYTPEGFAGQAFHLHVRYPGDWDELYFRDYLRTYPEAARAYEEVKKKLSIHYRNDRDGYTQAKTDIIREITQKARFLWKGRYRISDMEIL